MPTTLITGATDGIGLELAKRYHKQGHKLILIGRKPLSSLLTHHASLFTFSTYIQADLSQPDCIAKICAGLDERSVYRLDLVIHNAAVGYVGEIGEQSAESIKTLTTVNLIMPVKLTHALLPYLTKANGKLIFISSIVTALPSPKFAVYAAAKAALDGFARSLRIELKGKICVQVIHPGATKTGMHKKVGMTEKQYKRFPSAKKVAKKITRAITTNKRTVTIGFTNKLIRNVGPYLNRSRQHVTHHASCITSPHAVITGAADGIGKALIYRYAKAGYRVTGVDVDTVRAERVSAELTQQGAAVNFIITDLASEDYAWLEGLDSADVFIHNAGISATGHFATLNPNRQEKVLRLNLLTPLQITARLIEKNLLENGSTVVLISSLSHFVSYPGAVAYAASKDGLTHYARSLSATRQATLTVFPGSTRTAHARRYAPDNKNEASRMSPDRLADKIFTAQQSGQRILLPSPSAKLFATLGKRTPRLMEFAMRKTILDKFPTP